MEQSNACSGVSLGLAKLHHIEALIQRGWNQGVNSLDERGAPAWWTAPTAVSWCLIGAATKARADDIVILLADHLEPDFVKEIADRTEGWKDLSGYERSRILLIEYNDVPGRTKQDITDLLEKTRLAVEKR
jgi:hypothetical protein